MSRESRQWAGQPALTAEQFDCCTTGASGKSSQAARSVLVDGMRRHEAQAAHGLTAQAVSQAIGRVMKKHEQICRAYLMDNA
jgi:hypothetical protein